MMYQQCAGYLTTNSYSWDSCNCMSHLSRHQCIFNAIAYHWWKIKLPSFTFLKYIFLFSAGPHSPRGSCLPLRTWLLLVMIVELTGFQRTQGPLRHATSARHCYLRRRSKYFDSHNVCVALSHKDTRIPFYFSTLASVLIFLTLHLQ